MALGKLGWTEYEYYTSSPEAVYYAFRGYFSKLQDDSLAVRNLAAIFLGISGSKKKIDAIWPLDGEGKATFKPLTRQEWDNIMAKQKIVDRQIKKKK